LRVAVVSDIHSNLTAFRAVAADFGEVDEVWCVGDLVGYGPDPNECVALLREYPHVCVAGNHDWAALGKLETQYFNAAAAAAAAWTAERLSEETRDYLLGLPTELDREDWRIVHGSPRDPIWEYVLETSQGEELFSLFPGRGCLLGHTHIPLIFVETPDGVEYLDPEYGEPLELEASRVIVNPGGVGQPRDGDPRASYVLLDTTAGEIGFRRVEYDVGDVQARMREAGLPRPLWQRLSYGM
jgi:diadenosine tetraphosphatase ApaH/serine/threonine PP2A family protein phosphatase